MADAVEIQIPPQWDRADRASALEPIQILQLHRSEVIRQIATHPKVFRAITDDQSAGPEFWRAPIGEHVFWLVATEENGTPLGWGGFFARTGITAETHFAFLPNAYGQKARRAFAEMIEWMRGHTGFRRLIGEIPRSNRLALRFARRAGFKVYAVNRKSIQRQGQIEDQLCLELDL